MFCPSEATWLIVFRISNISVPNKFRCDLDFCPVYFVLSRISDSDTNYKVIFTCALINLQACNDKLAMHIRLGHAYNARWCRIFYAPRNAISKCKQIHKIDDIRVEIARCVLLQCKQIACNVRSMYFVCLIRSPFNQWPKRNDSSHTIWCPNHHYSRCKPIDHKLICSLWCQK